MSSSLKTVASFGLGRSRIQLRIVQGSVVDFVSPTITRNPNQHAANGDDTGAIVNAANEECLSGGGVDGAITAAGGSNLFLDRKALRNWPGHEPGIRCPAGHAVITGPGNYGELQVPYVIHAVGPNYNRFQTREDLTKGDQLLRSAYLESLDLCQQHEIHHVAFALLSAGVFKGPKTLSQVLTIAVEAIRDWANASSSSTGGLQSITLCGFSTRETAVLMEICQHQLS